MAQASRPIFIPVPGTSQLVSEVSLQFEWSMGMARTQKQKSVQSFHAVANKNGYSNPLEISTYSLQSIGVQLSAYNLLFKSSKSCGTVEELYQKSKVLNKTNESVLTDGDEKLKGRQPLHFIFEDYKWPLKPLSGFYDWLYINALHQNKDLANRVLEFNAFTDIAYNPKKSLSTQARSVALYVALMQLGKIEQIKDPKEFLELLDGYEYMRGVSTLF